MFYELTMARKAACTSLCNRDTIYQVIVKLLQALAGIIVIALYAVDLAADARKSITPSALWVFAVLVASVSCVTAVLWLMIPTRYLYRAPWSLMSGSGVGSGYRSYEDSFCW